MGSRYLAKVAVAVLLLSLGLAFLSGQSTHVAATSPSDNCYYWYYDCSYYNYYYNSYYPNCYSSNYYYNSYCGSYSYYSYPYYGSYGYSNNYYSTPSQYKLTVATDPPNVGSVTGAGTYSQGTSASFSVSQNTVQVSQTARYVFSHWSGDYTGVGTSGSLTINGASNVIAVYQLQYHLDVSVQPQTAPLPQGAGWYNVGDTVNLNSVGQMSGGQDGSRIVFQGWNVDGQTTQTGTSLMVQMNSPHSVTTQYKQQYYLKVMADQGVGYGEGWYDAGATAQIYASTPPSPSYGVSMVFNGWQGDIQSNSQSATVLMDEPKTAIATWRSDPTILYLTIGAAILAVTLIGAALLAYVALNRNRYPRKTLTPAYTRTQTVASPPPPPNPLEQKSVPLRKKHVTQDTEQASEKTDSTTST